MAENAVEKKNIFTATGVKKLEDELNNLIVVRRKEVAEKLKEARAQGDLSENAEYDAAKDEQRDIEARIEEIQTMLKNAEVVDEDEIDLEKVNVGCIVKTKDMTFKEEVTFQIVGSNETNSLENKISNESPLGIALVGKKIGQTAEVELPNGTKAKYKVLDIQRVEN
ncbi:MAG: transcription elongation factor GreA [Lachnospiraceae bacterium]|nr:transcription elongation factor GreA [Lachnospiraceae bacterium]